MVILLSTGNSFGGAHYYFGRDKDADTLERVAWSHTENMQTTDPEKAWKVMAYTAKSRNELKEAAGYKTCGRPLKQAVLVITLTWHPEQNPDKSHMIEMGRQALRDLKLSEHEAVFYAHQDEPHKHVHIMVNRVHPITGLTAKLTYSKNQMSRLALAYEQSMGKIYCKQREENARKRSQGKRTKYRDLQIATAWKETKDGVSFAAALARRGYTLAQGDRRIVVVDPKGKVINPLRHIEGVKTKEFRDRLGEPLIRSLRDADAVRKEVTARAKQDYAQQQSDRRYTAQDEMRLQSEHHDERSRLHAHHAGIIENERRSMIEDYRIEEQRRAIKALERKIEQASALQNLFGVTQRDRDELQDRRRVLANAEKRMNERLEFFERDRDFAMKELEKEQTQEKSILRRHGRKALKDHQTKVEFRPNPEYREHRRWRLGSHRA